MMTAEKWYEYQNNYRRHGFDMRPKVTKPVYEPKPSTVSLQERIKIISLVFLAGLLCIGLIISTAYVAGVRHEINNLSRQSLRVQGEIENLNIKVQRATNIRTIEQRAKEELGMIYPSPENFIFLSPDARPQGDFATRLRVQAFN